MILRIINWKEIYENAESRKLKTLKWVAMPNKMNTQGYTALVDHPNAAAHLGAWCAIVEICSAREPRELRGILPEADGTLGGISRALGRMSRLPGGIFEEVLPRLIDDPEIAWIEKVTEMSGESPGASGKSPDIPAAKGITRKGITGEGTEQKGDGMVIRSTAARKQDQSFMEFEADYLKTGGSFIDEDFDQAYQWRWKTLDVEQRLERHKALIERIVGGMWSDPRYVPKPQKFLETEWRRPIPKSRANCERSFVSDVQEVIGKRLAEEGKPW